MRTQRARLAFVALVMVLAMFLGQPAEQPNSKVLSAEKAAQEGGDSAAAQETPIGPRWWPSKWGADDQRGAANLMSPEKVLQANKLITEGRVFQLGRVYERDMPTFPFRTYRLTIPAFRKPPRGSNQQVGRDEFFVGEIGQMGTQFDGLGHVGVRLPDGDTWYNGLKSVEIEDAYGLTKLGIENAGPFFTRGVLIDVVAYRNADRLPVGYEITLDDLEGALDRQQSTITPGDVVLLRTGHSKLWIKDNETYNSGEPGIGLEAARWLIEQNVAIVGADNWGIEVDPPPNGERPIEVHQQMITRNGIYFLENLDLEELASAEVHEFAFIFAPLRLKGATGSPGNPIAVR
ncbi:MAG: cyclase family protein [Planctomycetaceae bacterium]|nr:cyclase family protein [Planctomycetaceae bacterium]